MNEDVKMILYLLLALWILNQGVLTFGIPQAVTKNDTSPRKTYTTDTSYDEHTEEVLELYRKTHRHYDEY